MLNQNNLSTMLQKTWPIIVKPGRPHHRNLTNFVLWSTDILVKYVSLPTQNLALKGEGRGSCFWPIVCEFLSSGWQQNCINLSWFLAFVWSHQFWFQTILETSDNHTRLFGLCLFWHPTQFEGKPIPFSQNQKPAFFEPKNTARKKYFNLTAL